METGQLLGKIDLRSDLIAVLIVAAAILIILYLNRLAIRRWLGDWRSRRGLDRLGGAQIRGFRCPDGLDGYYSIDRLVLTNAAILLISRKPFGGNIFCAEQIEQWTQVIGQKSFQFDNPLFELQHQRTALQSLIGKAELRAYLYFDESARFPKGHPPAVLHTGHIPDAYLRANCRQPRPDIQLAWQRLEALHQAQRADDPEAGPAGA